MREYLDAHGKGKNAVKTCRKYRLATSPYLKFMKKNMNAVAGYDVRNKRARVSDSCIG